MRKIITDKLDRLLYFFKKNFYVLFNRKEYLLLNNNIFIAYTMGKVGSITIEKAISQKVFYNKVFHVHFLSQPGLKAHKEFNKTDSGYKLAARFEAEWKNNKHKRLKVITLVREPVSRDISDLFENYYRYIPEQKETGIILDKMLDQFKKFDHPYALEWFDKELKTYLGVDIYAYDFNKPQTNYRQKFFYTYNRHNEFNLNLGLVNPHCSYLRYSTRQLRIPKKNFHFCAPQIFFRVKG